jgi:cytochrome b subunit of formate dehydrogenase
MIGMTEPVRANLHRIFAVIMIATSISHMWYIFLTRRGRIEFRDILPAPSDFVDFIRNIRFHTWRSSEEAKFGRYDYSQKAEYWALIWGTILMIITGIVLWFPETAVKILPVWTISASQTIHYYEAWLATLAILVWHFFFVIFHPEEYPMSWTWLTGKMSRKAVKKHHARWYEEEFAGKETDESETVVPTPGKESVE